MYYSFYYIVLANIVLASTFSYKLDGYASIPINFPNNTNFNVKIFCNQYDFFSKLSLHYIVFHGSDH